MPIHLPATGAVAPLDAFGRERRQTGGGGAFGSGALPDDPEQIGYKGQYVQNATALTFDTPTDGPYGPAAAAVSRAVFETPLLDLRGDLAESTAYADATTTIRRELMLGVRWSLHIDFDLTFTNSGFDTWRWYYVLKGASMNANRANQVQGSAGTLTPRYLSARQDITHQVNAGWLDTSGATDVLRATLRWTPYGPLRYWGVAIVCDFVSVGNFGTPGFLLSAELH